MGRTTLIACLSVLCFNALATSGLEEQTRKNGIAIAQSYVGLKEATGNNDGKAIKMFQECVHIKSGQPWCAGLPCVVYTKLGYDAKITGRAISCCEDEFLINPKAAQPLDLFYYPSHTGIIEYWPVRGDFAYTIEGNYSNRVAQVRRKKNEFTKVANVLSGQLKEENTAAQNHIVNPHDMVEPDAPVPTKEPSKTNPLIFILVAILILL